MSGIAKLSEKMKKKISFGDYTLSAEPVMPVAQPIIEPIIVPVAAPQASARKIYSLTQDDATRLQEIFSKRIAQQGQSSICQIMSDAIQLLHQNELPKRAFSRPLPE